MATTLKKSPAAQTLLSAVFNWGYTTGGADGTSDQMLNINGVLTSFNVATASTPTFDVMTLPAGATVVGGTLNVETAVTAAGACGVAVGDDASASRYLSNTSIKTATATALVPTGFKLDTSRPIRLTFTNAGTDNAVGKCRLVVNFVIDGRASVNLKTT